MIDDISIPGRPIDKDKRIFNPKFTPAAVRAINRISHQRPADSRNKVTIADIRPEKK